VMGGGANHGPLLALNQGPTTLAVGGMGGMGGCGDAKTDYLKQELRRSLSIRIRSSSSSSYSAFIAAASSTVPSTFR